MNTPVIDEVDGTPQGGGVSDPWDTSMPAAPELSHKEQHRLRAKLVRQGERALAFHQITDYRSATPTFKPRPKKRKSRAKVKAAPAPVAVPKKIKTKADLLIRVNSHLRGA